MKYGLAEFGDFDYAEINSQIAQAINEVFGADVEIGALVLVDVLSELYQKAESITDGCSAEYRMFTSIGHNADKRHALTKKIFQILSSVWKYALQINEGILSKASMCPSKKCKAAGLKSLAELSRISGESVQTLINWNKNKPQLFSVLIAGAVVIKAD